MSLIGIDLGTSAIKVGAYALDGTALAQARRPVPGYHPEPGHWEVDVLESRDAFGDALAAVAADPALQATRRSRSRSAPPAARSSRSRRTARRSAGA